MATLSAPPVWRQARIPFCTSPRGSSGWQARPCAVVRWRHRTARAGSARAEDSPQPSDDAATPAAPPGLAARRPQLQSLRLTKGTLPLRVLVGLSAVAALLYLRQKRSNNKPANMQAPQLSEVKRIDSHLHVWASPEESQRFPYAPGQVPTLAGSAADLLAVMAEAQVDGALIVQPINHGFDHSYVCHVVNKYPDTFVGCCLANPTQGMAGVQELERLVKEDGFKAVRFNPYLWPQGEKMTNAVGKALFAKAGELGVPVGFMCFKGLLLHIDEIEELCKQFPATTVLIDHLGFCKPSADGSRDDDWGRLLGLARFPQVYVKVSAIFRVSREDYPYKDIWPRVRQLADVFGARRLMWGSDFPFVQQKCGYSAAWSLLLTEQSLFTEEELQWIFGGTIQTLLGGLQWGGKPVVPFGGKWAEQLVAPY